MPYPPLTVVVAYGRADLLAACLAVMAGPGSVLVVDNSRSAEVALVCSDHGADYVAPDRNLGFAAGVNVGIGRRATGQDVLLVNSDAELDPQDKARLVLLMHESGHRVAAAAPRLLRPDGAFERTLWPMPSPQVVWAGALGLADRAARVSFASGAVLLLNGAALDELGGFDERFFMYAEEADWQRRALNAGWTVEVCEAAVARHIGGASSSDPALRETLFHASAELYARKWFGTGGWWVFRAGAVVAALRRLVVARSAEQRRLAALVARLYLTGPARALPAARKALT